MKLTQITVSYGETQSLPDYSNVKPQLTLTATLDEGDDPARAEAHLWQQAKEAVHEQIDAALEASGRAARHSTEPRYQVMRSYWDRYGKPKDAIEPPRLVVIAPDALELGTGFVTAAYPDSRRLRHAHAQRVAAEAVQEHRAILADCSNLDQAQLEAVLAGYAAEAPAAQASAAPDF